MAAISLHELLASTTVTRVISQLKRPNNKLQRFFGMTPGGPSSNPVGGHHAGWDRFDHTRTLATGRAPGSGPATTAPNVVGHVPVQLYRSHEKITLIEERIFRTRPIGGQFGSVDRRGQAYITKQEAYLAQRFFNMREFMVSRMLRGSFFMRQDGDNTIPNDSTGIEVDYRVPAANKSQLNMLAGGNIIDAVWSAAGTDILAQLMNINAAFEQLHGLPLRHIWLNSAEIRKVMDNTDFQTIGGSANTIFNTFNPSGDSRPDGSEDTDLLVVFRAIPWVTWHVYDAGLVVDGTFTKFLPDDRVSFMSDPSTDWTEWLEGSEIVAENIMSPGTEQFGFHAWTERVTQPAGFELIGVDNGLPALYIPDALAYATTEGF